MTATTAIYILGETHKLNPYSNICHLGDPQHNMMFIIIENKFTFSLLNISKQYDWKV